jgi:Ca-activated chloride channel family protein
MRNYCILSLLLLLLSTGSAHASAYGDVSSGNSLYKKGEYDKSLDKYRDAQMAAPNNPAVYFNMGDAQTKAGDMEGANSDYTKALSSKDKLLRSKAYYNLGNVAFSKEKPDEALADYKKCLELNPNDMDAKYNIEYLLTQKNAPKQNKNDKNDKNDKNNKDNKQQKAGAKGNDKDNKDKDKQDKDKSKSGMSKEDAQRILQYYNDQEKQSADKRKMKTPEQPKTDEDW